MKKIMAITKIITTKDPTMLTAIIIALEDEFDKFDGIELASVDDGTPELAVGGHCVTPGGQVSPTNKNFSIDIKFYMKKRRKKSRLHA